MEIPFEKLGTAFVITAETERPTKGALEVLRRIPVAAVRRAVSLVPPYRVDVHALLMFSANVIDPSWYYASIRISEIRCGFLWRTPTHRPPRCAPIGSGSSWKIPWLCAL
jgi:hypothetical protein